jgi:hypothetical protein
MQTPNFGEQVQAILFESESSVMPGSSDSSKR